ncbi:MAG: N-acetyltransferase family protein [Bacteroidota bacterium]
MNVRLAQETDAHSIATVFNQYVGRATMVLQPRSEVDYLPIITGERSTVFVAEEVHRPFLGFASVKPYSPRGGYHIAGEVSIFLDEAATGKGTGTALYEKLLPAAESLGYRYLCAKIWGTNTGSVRFHERHGFRLVGTQKGIGQVGGKRVDVIFMERSI